MNQSHEHLGKALDSPRACPVCDSHEAKLVLIHDFSGRERRFLIGECLTCGMTYVMNSDDIDMSNRQYVDWKPESDRDVVTRDAIEFNIKLITYLSKFVAPGARILDYGSGYCGFLRVAQERGFHVEGVNPCRYLAEWARDRFGIVVHNVFGEHFRTESGYDLIVSDQTFEHLEHPLRDLASVEAALKPGGYAYLNVPNWSHYTRYLRGYQVLMDVTHYNYFRPGNLRALASRSSMKTVTCCPNIEGQPARRAAKAVLNMIGLGDSSVLLQRPLQP